MSNEGTLLWLLYPWIQILESTSTKNPFPTSLAPIQFFRSKKAKDQVFSFGLPHGLKAEALWSSEKVVSVKLQTFKQTGRKNKLP